MQSVTINGNQAGQRLDKFLRKYLPEAGTGFLYKMLRKKNITLNGKKAEGSELLTQGDQVSFFFSDETFAKFSGRNAGISAGISAGGIADISAGRSTGGDITSCNLQGFRHASENASELAEYNRAYRELTGIDVIYEDEHVLILNKPVGILTQKAEEKDLSLNEWMIGYLLNSVPDFETQLVGFRPSVCNRLDRNTSGLVLCGKSLPGLQFLSQCIRERSIRKFYRTICHGQLRDSALVKGYLKKDESRNRVRVVPVELGQKGQSIAAKHMGEYIETAYRPICVGEEYTLLEVELITGKPHQIRAHLAGLGHPLIGDFKYGDIVVNKKMQQALGLKHQMLHAFRVEFPKAEGMEMNAETASTAEPSRTAVTVGLSLSGKIITAPCPKQFKQIQIKLGLSD